MPHPLFAIVPFPFGLLATALVYGETPNDIKYKIRVRLKIKLLQLSLKQCLFY